MNPLPSLPREVLAFCRPRWNNNTLTSNNSLQTIQCCLNSCEDTIDYCFKNCPKNKDSCFQKCRDITLDCRNSCYDLPSSGIGAIQKCLEPLNCGSFPDIDYDCFNRNKEAIINCCYSNTKDDNCREFCNTIQKPQQKTKFYSSTDSPPVSHEENKAVYVLVLCLFLSLFGVYLLSR